jgi:hypothetical protein
LNPLVAILRPIFDAFFQAAFAAWRESQRATIEPVTEADRAELEKLREIVRARPPAGPDGVQPPRAP